MKFLFDFSKVFTLRDLFVLIGLIAFAIFAISSSVTGLAVSVIIAVLIPFFLLPFGEAFKAVLWCVAGIMAGIGVLVGLSQIIFPNESPRVHSQQYLQYWEVAKFIPPTVLVLFVWTKWIVDKNKVSRTVD